MDFKKIIAYLFNIITISTLLCSSSIIIREATEDDRVSYKFFKNLYKKKSYAHLPYGKDTEGCLEKELLGEVKMFEECVSNKSDYQLLIACNKNSYNTIVGLIAFHNETPNSMQLDLLLVDTLLRGQGIGTKLVHAALDACPMAKTCTVYPYRLENDLTLRFYEKLGFVRQGLGPADKINCHGVSYAVAYLHYELYLDKAVKKEKDRSPLPLHCNKRV